MEIKPDCFGDYPIYHPQKVAERGCETRDYIGECINERSAMMPEYRQRKKSTKSTKRQKWLKEELFTYLEEKTRPNARQVGGSHYKDLGIEPWDVIDTWPIEQQIGYYRGNALKYLMRLGSKDASLKEAKKAQHYCEKLIEVLENE